MSKARKATTKKTGAKPRSPAQKKKAAKKAAPPRRTGPPASVLEATCYLAGPGPNQDAFFVLLPNGTFRTLVHEGGISGQSTRIESAPAAYKLVVRLQRAGWVLVGTPRRTEQETAADMAVKVGVFLARKSRRLFVPDPNANVVPPARELARQQERSTLAAAKVMPGFRPLPGGAVETKRRKH